MKYLRQIKTNPSLIRDYIVGNYRLYMLNTSTFTRALLRQHIIDQFYYRKIKANRECVINGSCIKCGCETPELFFANRACEGNCYPKMMSKKEWYKYRKYGV